MYQVGLHRLPHACISVFVRRLLVSQEQAEAAAAKAGLLIGEADQSYLPSPLPPLVESTLAVLEVKLLVIAWRREAMEPWLLRPQPT